MTTAEAAERAQEAIRASGVDCAAVRAAAARRRTPPALRYGLVLLLVALVTLLAAKGLGTSLSAAFGAVSSSL